MEEMCEMTRLYTFTSAEERPTRQINCSYLAEFYSVAEKVTNLTCDAQLNIDIDKILAISRWKIVEDFAASNRSDGMLSKAISLA